MKTENQTKVWDLLVRTFHWLLVLTFIVAFATEDSLTIHSWAGYLIVALIAVRFLWGFIGTKHARFRDFVTSPKLALSYTKDVLAHRARRYIGHNPAGGIMILMLMASLIITSMTGIAVLGAAEQAGPMASWFVGAGEFWEDFFEGLHEFFANFTLLLVLIHLAGVLIESLIHKENLVRSMINGLKRAE